VRVIVTRPAAQAVDWVLRLAAKGIDAVALPLIAIEPLPDAAELIAAWHGLAQQRLAIFVSPNACEQFFALRPPAVAWPDRVYAGAPGPGTTRVLIGFGVPPSQIIEPAETASQFDSESLWAQLALHDWHDAGVLILRGDVGRDWLAGVLRSHGARVTHLAAYRRVLPVLSDVELGLLRDCVDAPASFLWLFSSSEAIDNLAELTRRIPDVDWGESLAIATHPRISDGLRRLGFARVQESRPLLDDLVACIQSFGP
jgi:uroporphyrinogen-III synthase